MTLAELVEKLQTLPQDIVVRDFLTAVSVNGVKVGFLLERREADARPVVIVDHTSLIAPRSRPMDREAIARLAAKLKKMAMDSGVTIRMIGEKREGGGDEDL